MPISKVIHNYYEKYVPAEFRRLQNDIGESISYGSQAGKKWASINNKGLVKDLYVRTKSTARNFHVDKEDIIPVVGIVLGTALIPCLGGSYIGFVIGKGLKKLARAFKR